MGKLIVFLSLIMPVFMYGMDKIYVKPTGNRKQKETKAIQRSNLFIKKTRQHYQQAPQAPMPQAQILVGEGDEQRLIVGISSCSFDVEHLLLKQNRM